MVFEIFEHTADLGLRVRAPSREGLFREAVEGLYAVILGEPTAIEARSPCEIFVPGERDDHLLLDLLQELLFRFETDGLLLRESSVAFDSGGVRLRARGESFDPDRHTRNLEVKAVTYHGLKVEERDDGWWAVMILDV